MTCDRSEQILVGLNDCNIPHYCDNFWLQNQLRVGPQFPMTNGLIPVSANLISFLMSVGRLRVYIIRPITKPDVWHYLDKSWGEWLCFFWILIFKHSRPPTAQLCRPMPNACSRGPTYMQMLTAGTHAYGQFSRIFVTGVSLIWNKWISNLFFFVWFISAFGGHILLHMYLNICIFYTY